MNKNAPPPRNVGDHQAQHHMHNGSTRRGGKRGENIFKEIMA